MVEAERELIQRALQLAEGNKTRTAQILGVSRKQPYAKIAKSGLTVDQPRLNHFQRSTGTTRTSPPTAAGLCDQGEHRDARRTAQIIAPRWPSSRIARAL